MKLIAGLLLGVLLSIGAIYVVDSYTAPRITRIESYHKPHNRHAYKVQTIVLGCGVVIALGGIQYLIHLSKQHEKG